MSTKAQRISRQSDNSTYCRPSDGYDTDTAIGIELGDYDEVGTVAGELPDSDQSFPKGAPLKDYVKVGQKIFKKKPD